MRALMLVAALAAAPIPADQPSIAFTDYPQVKKIACDEGSGTGFRLAGAHWASVAHVTALHECQIDGLPIAVTEQDGTHDFARLDVGHSAKLGLKIDCHGMIPGTWVWAAGYAGGKDYQTALALYVTYAKSADGKRVLLGELTVIPGMSGGPIMNREGEVVGLVNAYVPGTPMSLSRELRDTSLCSANIA